MFKKIYALSICMLLAALMPIPNASAAITDTDSQEECSLAAETAGEDPITGDYYSYDPATKTLTFTDPGSATDVAWPDEEFISDVTTLIIPDTYNYIPVRPKGVDPVNLKTITLPSTITEIPNGAFQGCAMITDVIIPKNVTYIGKSAFANCDALQNVTFPSNLEIIDEFAFANCPNLGNITFPDTVHAIKSHAFSYCESFTELTLPAGIADIVETDALDIANGLIDLENIERLIVPFDTKFETLEVLGFSPDQNLRLNVICNETLAQDIMSFPENRRLSFTANVDNAAYKYSGKCGETLQWTLSCDTGLLEISGTGEMDDYGQSPDPALDFEFIYPEWYSHRNAIKSIQCKDGVSSIGTFAFCDLIYVEDIILSDTVHSIKANAFQACSGLTNLKIPTSLSFVGSYAFSGCDSLTSITFPGEELALADSALENFFFQNITILSKNPEFGDSVFPSEYHSLNLYVHEGSATDYLENYEKSDDPESGLHVITICVVTFDDSNIGGSLPADILKVHGVVLGQPLDVTPAVKDDEGYVFDGWYTDKTGGTKLTSDTVFSEDTTLYARWKLAAPIPTPTPVPTPTPTPIPTATPTPDPNKTVEIKPDGTKIETIVEKKTAGYTNKTQKTTKVSGDIELYIVSTTNDQKKQTIVDLAIAASGQLKKASVEVSHVISGKKMTLNLKELKALTDQISVCDVSGVHPIGYQTSTIVGASVLGAYEEYEPGVLGVTQKNANIAVKISAKDTTGKVKFNVSIQKKDLSQNKFVVYKSDKKNNAVMVDTKKNTAKVSSNRDLSLSIAKKGNYQLQNSKDAAKTNKAIMKTVAPKKANVSVATGAKTSFNLSKKCNTANISKIAYSSNSSNVTVNKKGKIQASAPGSAKVTAKVTMNNGAKKKISMNVKVS